MYENVFEEHFCFAFLKNLNAVECEHNPHSTPSLSTFRFQFLIFSCRVQKGELIVSRKFIYYRVFAHYRRIFSVLVVHKSSSEYLSPECERNIQKPDQQIRKKVSVGKIDDLWIADDYGE